MGVRHVSITNNRIWSPHTTYSVALQGFLNKYIVTNNYLTVASYIDSSDSSGEGIVDNTTSGTNYIITQNPAL
jgi:hypothetical protein